MSKGLSRVENIAGAFLPREQFVGHPEAKRTDKRDNVRRAGVEIKYESSFGFLNYKSVLMHCHSDSASSSCKQQRARDCKDNSGNSRIRA